MNLEDYFEFLAPNDIRVKGHRIGIEDVIRYYLEGYTPEQIQTELPSLSLEQIYATLTYYFRERTALDAYLLHRQQEQEQHYQDWLRTEPSPTVQRLRAFKEQHSTAPISDRPTTT